MFEKIPKQKVVVWTAIVARCALVDDFGVSYGDSSADHVHLSTTGEVVWGQDHHIAGTKAEICCLHEIKMDIRVA
jgi:hypothetical protein